MSRCRCSSCSSSTYYNRRSTYSSCSRQSCSNCSCTSGTSGTSGSSCSSCSSCSSSRCNSCSCNCKSKHNPPAPISLCEVACIGVAVGVSGYISSCCCPLPPLYGCIPSCASVYRVICNSGCCGSSSQDCACTEKLRCCQGELLACQVALKECQTTNEVLKEELDLCVASAT